MATGNIGVDIAVIESTATDIRTENSTMKTNLTEISDGVNNLKTAWQSEAADQLSTISTKMTSGCPPDTGDPEARRRGQRSDIVKYPLPRLHEGAGSQRQYEHDRKAGCRYADQDRPVLPAGRYG